MGKIGKSLVSLVRENPALRKMALVSSVAVPLFFGGCEKPKIELPKANLEISPEYGKHPLTTSIKLNGTSVMLIVN